MSLMTMFFGHDSAGGAQWPYTLTVADLGGDFEGYDSAVAGALAPTLFEGETIDRFRFNQSTDFCQLRFTSAHVGSYSSINLFIQGYNASAANALTWASGTSDFRDSHSGIWAYIVLEGNVNCRIEGVA